MSIIHPQIAIDRIRMTADYHQREIERQVDDLIARTDARIKEEIHKSRRESSRQRLRRLMKDHDIETPNEMKMAILSILAFQDFKKLIKTEILDDL